VLIYKKFVEFECSQNVKSVTSQSARNQIDRSCEQHLDGRWRRTLARLKLCSHRQASLRSNQMAGASQAGSSYLTPTVRCINDDIADGHV
jgi:hypothetical protein